MSEIKSTFERNEFYERLIAMRSADRKTFNSLSQPTQWALLAYGKQKRGHSDLEAMHQEVI